MSVSTILSEDYWVLETRGASGTLVIGATFIFLAYFLHPAVESSYQRVRAYRAWRAIEMRQAVEVTQYPMMAELFGGRGKWDAARIIRALLAVFSLASWGLELSIEIAAYEGVADLLNRPPPVETGKVDGLTVWKVKSCDDLFYDGKWWLLDNVFENHAKSRYNLKSGKHTGKVDGDITVASFNTKPDDLFYYNGEEATEVESVNCTGANATDVYKGDDFRWGSVSVCERGPRLMSESSQQRESKQSTPPTLVMRRPEDRQVFLIVEESSSYPSFMYSVWNVTEESGNPTKLNHLFHIAATMRLAEAVVTGIVNGEITAGGCFGLLRQHSERFQTYSNDAERALPFGERPNGDSSARIQDQETIEYGLKIGANALLCFVWVMLLTSIGVAWSLCLRSSIGMDVYDRDKLMRAVSLHGVEPGGTPPSEIRIFVSREDTGNISVVISNTGNFNNACSRFLKRSDQVVKDVDPSPVAATVDQYNRGFGGVDVPVGPRTVWLEGVRTGMSRPLPGPNGDYHYPTSVALSASPVPSNAGSLVSTPIPSPTRRAFVRRERTGLPAGRGASVMFDSEYSSGDSPEDTPNRMRAARFGSTITGAGAPGAQNATLEGERPILAVSQATSASDIEMLSLSDRSVGNGELSISSVSPDWKPPARRGITRGHGQLGRFTTEGSERDTEECTSSSDNLNMETTESPPSCERSSTGNEKC